MGCLWIFPSPGWSNWKIDSGKHLGHQQPAPAGAAVVHICCVKGEAHVARMQFSNRKCVGYAGSYFCFPISLPDAEILRIGVRGIQPVQLWHWPCAWLLGPMEGALQGMQCYSIRRVKHMSLKALRGKAGATTSLCWADSWEGQLMSGAVNMLTNTMMKHNPIFLHYREETGSLQFFSVHFILPEKVCLHHCCVSQG